MLCRDILHLQFHGSVKQYKINAKNSSWPVQKLRVGAGHGPAKFFCLLSIIHGMRQVPVLPPDRHH